MEKAEVIQKLIFFTSEMTLLIFFTSENITFEICKYILFHQYFPILHLFVCNKISFFIQSEN